MTTVERLRCPEHGIPDCSPLLNGCTWRPLSSYELAREQYAAQLVDDVRDVLRAELIGDKVLGDAQRYDEAAAAVVRLVYPTLAQVVDRDDELALMEDARRICDVTGRLSLDGDGYRQEDVHAFVASLLRDLRRLYDDAQNVREQYGAETRRAHDERDEAQQELADLRYRVREVRKLLRGVRTGRG